ncbi:trypsin-like serine protease [Actinoallomurus spadix]|uniref:Peptidase S1 domain-containing protein n=1 Tax=Actinoallomurus spadix TaxID=79912 RepID=A0ABP3G346_9ACTN|nr:trypsin-like serine protease [Actinoallomurus spadix]MCO5987142.1 trypsin-like serine protease [Actinoallomurus spadix]
MLHGALLTAALSAIVMPAVAADVETIRAVSHAEPDTVRAAAYWTVSRMASATPPESRSAGKAAERSGPPAGTPTAKKGGGSRVVGALFYNNGSGNHYCTASVMHTSKKDLILTAAHCLYDPHKHTYATHIAFVPKYNTSRPRPYGVWPIRKTWLDARWTRRGDPDLDYGFAALNKVGGRHIVDVVGSNVLRINQGYSNRVTVIGYPAKSHNPADKPVRCVNRTFKQWKYQIGFDCKGLYGGTSGSPWMIQYNDKTESGLVIGTLGGYQEGGDTDWRSYSALFDNDITKLIVKADKEA